MINYSVKENLNTNVNDLNYDLLKAAEAMSVMVDEIENGHSIGTHITFEQMTIYLDDTDPKSPYIYVRTHEEASYGRDAKHGLSIKLYNTKTSSRDGAGHRIIIKRKDGDQKFDRIAKDDLNGIANNKVRRFVKNFIYDNYGYIRHYWNYDDYVTGYTLDEIAEGIRENLRNNDYSESGHKYEINYNGTIFDRETYDSRKGGKKGKGKK